MPALNHLNIDVLNVLLLFFLFFSSRPNVLDDMEMFVESELILLTLQASGALSLAHQVQNELVGWLGGWRGDMPYYAVDYPLLSTATVKLLSPLLWG